MTVKSALAIVMFAIFSTTPAGAKDTSGWGHHWPDGYLEKSSLPDSLSLLPPSPTWGTPRQLMDEALNAEALELEGTARFHLATKDADLNFPNAADNFSCALGIEISVEKTPVLYDLMRKTMTDAGHSTKTAKEKYQRKRPFQVNGKTTCTPDDETFLSHNGSYPSGHATIGWTWALILAQISPDRSDAVLKRGMSFGNSRVICNVHWQSDVVEGRVLGAAVVAKLHGVAEFRSDLETAKTEVAAGQSPSTDCAGEAETLKSWLH
ncbi:acid phosphatase [Roseibium sp. SCP14]|uniref:acid phosphatase n=1 Tax=Roseibium sp. SCP14 TaxID=3141375 RepID=UPI003338940A